METPENATLRVRSILKPERVEDLTPLQRKQLVAAGRKYDGGDYSAAERLSYEGSDAHPGGQRQSFKGFIEIREIVDAQGRPAYDAYLYMVDSGTIFRAGTIEVVAEIIQFGLECDDEALEAALEPVVGRKPVTEKEEEGAASTKVAAKKATTKKATKPAAKKAPARKVAKKAPAKKSAKKAPAKKSAKKAPAKKAAAKKTAAKKAPAKKRPTRAR